MSSWCGVLTKEIANWLIDWVLSGFSSTWNYIANIQQTPTFGNPPCPICIPILLPVVSSMVQLVTNAAKLSATWNWLYWSRPRTSTSCSCEVTVLYMAEKTVQYKTLRITVDKKAKWDWVIKQQILWSARVRILWIIHFTLSHSYFTLCGEVHGY